MHNIPRSNVGYNKLFLIFIHFEEAIGRKVKDKTIFNTLFVQAKIIKRASNDSTKNIDENITINVKPLFNNTAHDAYFTLLTIVKIFHKPSLGRDIAKDMDPTNVKV